MDHNRRIPMVIILSVAVISGGCQSDPKPVAVAEYRPMSAPTTRKAPNSQVFILWRWQPIAPLGVDASTQPTGVKPRPPKQFQVEVEQVYLPRGAPLGFRKSDGQLLAVSGPTTLDLSDAHYVWMTGPVSNDQRVNRSQRVNQAVVTVGTIIVIGVVIFALGYFIHADRHSLLGDVFDSD
jgi:hypothetical protein